MLRTTLNESSEKMSIFEFSKKAREICEKLDIPESFLLYFI